MFAVPVPFHRRAAALARQGTEYGSRVFGRTYLLVAGVVGAAIVVLGAFGASRLFLTRFTEEEYRDKIGEVATLVAPVVENHLTPDDLAGPMPPDRQDVILSMIVGDASERLRGLQVWNLDGAPIVGDGAVAPPSADDLRAVASGASIYREAPETGGDPLLDAYVPLRLGPDRRVAGVVGARTSAQHLRQEIADVREFLYRTLGGSLTLAFLAMLTVLYLGQRGIRQRERALLERSREIAQARHEISLAIVGALDLRDVETEGHSVRVQGLSVAIARELGCSEDDIEIIGLGALLHDIGKIGVSDRVLRKPGPLTDDEWEEIKRHPELGYRFLRKLTIASRVADIVRAHHERWDGRGYPLGLAGEAIPLGARIFAVADAFDAMTSDRPYRRALTRDAAIAEIARCSGTQFDPRVVEAFLRVAGVSELPALQLAA